MLFEFIKSQAPSTFGQHRYVQLPTDRGISQCCLNFKAAVEHSHFTALSGIVFGCVMYFSPKNLLVNNAMLTVYIARNGFEE